MAYGPYELALSELTEAIRSAFADAFGDPAGDYQTIGFYLGPSPEVQTPAISLEMDQADYTQEDDVGTGQPPMLLQFAARVIVHSEDYATVSEAKAGIRSRAFALLQLIHLNTWGNRGGESRIIGVYPDEFSDDQPQWHVYRVEWSQLMYVGESTPMDYLFEGDTPTDPMYGFEPETGPDNEDKYTDANPEG